MNRLDLRAEIAKAADYLRARRWTAAEFAIRSVLIAWPDWPEGLREAGGLALRLHGVDAADRGLMHAIIRNPDDARTWFLMVRTRFAARDIAGGWAAARRSVTLQPGHREVPSFLAALAIHRGDHRAAALALSRAACLGPLSMADLQIRMAACLQLGLLSRADHTARRILVADPVDGSALSAMARARHRQRDADMAWRLLRRLAVLRPTDPETLTAVSRIFLARRRIGDAEYHARRSLVAGAAAGETYLDLARPLWRREDFAAAERVMAWAELVDPAMALRNRILRLTATKRDFAVLHHKNRVSTPV